MERDNHGPRKSRRSHVEVRYDDDKDDEHGHDKGGSESHIGVEPGAGATRTTTISDGIKKHRLSTSSSHASTTHLTPPTTPIVSMVPPPLVAPRKFPEAPRRCPARCLPRPSAELPVFVWDLHCEDDRRDRTTSEHIQFIKWQADIRRRESETLHSTKCLDPDLGRLTARTQFASIEPTAPMVDIYGLLPDGSTILLHVHGFFPYFWVFQPLACTESPQLFQHRLGEALKARASTLEGTSSSSLQGRGPDPRALLRIESYHCPHTATASSPATASTGTPSPWWRSCWTYDESNGPDSKRIAHRIILSTPTQVAKYRSMLHDELVLGALSSSTIPGQGGRIIPSIRVTLPTFESDVPFVLRFMVDRGVVGCGWLQCAGGQWTPRALASDCQSTCQWEVDVWHRHVTGIPVSDRSWSFVPPLRILSFDIECKGRPGHFPDAKTDPICQITGLVAEIGSSVHSSGSEEQLLRDWWTYWHSADPDVITGWNIGNFDLPYVLNRVAVHDMTDPLACIGRQKGTLSKIRIGDKGSKQTGRRSTTEIDIKGRLSVDMLLRIRADYKLRSYTLNAVSLEILKRQKDDVHHSIISKLAETDSRTRNRLARYGLKDAVLPLVMMIRLKTLIDLVEMARITGVPFLFLLTRGQQIKVVSQLLRALRQRQFLCPTFESSGGEEQFEGALVIEPKAGFYRDPVMTLDFASLYPSIMIAHNLCFSTLVQHPMLQAEVRRTKTKGIDYQVTPAGHMFMTSKMFRGILPEVLEKLLRERKIYKQAINEAKTPDQAAIFNGRQMAIKISANSVYGFTGAHKMRCVAISESVTAYGRDMLLESCKAVGGHFLNVVSRCSFYHPHTRPPTSASDVSSFSATSASSSCYYSSSFPVSFSSSPDSSSTSLASPCSSSVSSSSSTSSFSHSSSPSSFSSSATSSTSSTSATPCSTGAPSPPLSDVAPTVTPAPVPPAPATILTRMREWQERERRGATPKRASQSRKKTSLHSSRTTTMTTPPTSFLYSSMSSTATTSTTSTTSTTTTTIVTTTTTTTTNTARPVPVPTADTPLSKPRAESVVDMSNTLAAKATVDAVTGFSAEVIYGDTDSLMVHLVGMKVEECMEMGPLLAAEASKRFQSPIRLEFEKVYWPFLLLNRKRYAGLIYAKSAKKPDKLDTKGLETVRRDNCPLAEQLAQDMLDRILKFDIPGAVDRARSTIRELCHGEVDISQLVIGKGYSRPIHEYKSIPAHVQLAARMALRDRLSAPVVGDRVPYVVTLRQPTPPMGAAVSSHAKKLHGGGGEEEQQVHSRLPTKGKSSKKVTKCTDRKTPLLADLIEDPQWVLEHGIPINIDYYKNNQLQGPITRILGPIIPRSELTALFQGDHTRYKSKLLSELSVSIKVGGGGAGGGGGGGEGDGGATEGKGEGEREGGGGLLRHIHMGSRCIRCRSPQLDTKGTPLPPGVPLCNSCRPFSASVYLEALDKLREQERQSSACWSYCQRCQGSLMDTVICANSDCTIFYRRMRSRQLAAKFSRLVSDMLW